MEPEKAIPTKKMCMEPEKAIPRRSNRLITPSISTITPYKAPRNPATVAVHPLFNPLMSPSFESINEMHAWKSSNMQQGVITDTQPLTPGWFDWLEQPWKHLQETHIDAAVAVMWLRRNQDPIFFNNRRLPKSTFVRTSFLTRLLDCYPDFKKDNLKPHFFFPSELTDIVRGTSYSICPPVQKWEDIDVVYGVAHNGNSMFKQYMGIEINIKNRAVTGFECQSKNWKSDMVQSHLQPIAEMILYVLGCVKPNGPVAYSKFSVSIPSKFILHNMQDENCALYTVKMLECRSMGIEDMIIKLPDVIADDTRVKVAIDIYKELVIRKIDIFSL